MNLNISKNMTKMAAKKKKTTRKRTTKRRAPVKKVETKSTEPDYMVQVSEPKLVRKDLLESLREVIIFMQGYEKFRRIQEEKVALFTQLKIEVKQLNVLVNDKLRKYLPKGKLRAVTPQNVAEQQQKAAGIGPQVQVVNQPAPTTAPPKQELEDDNLAQLEGQLRDIERQLQGIK
ncbi:hypothetical protein HOL21_01295 [Candidatus Woesearchaeota archaeon]|jgi:hypothetical protein|nr:hypothetical protein [Candidatus Woesearchaeota archaeon]MBT5396828.1 hypothetical protein [Candidatus Woesearchaeota archaeon]MBT5924840.1 hypothetical protein [Candidatus Woesearchaeota archaeon]MBT6367716.1 hypothetical protein [Candidatus Woesearchaeota archaeon]MBT7762883.1 hypothetical protein [Candidatus Woesearchaeota archaeon]